MGGCVPDQATEVMDYIQVLSLSSMEVWVNVLKAFSLWHRWLLLKADVYEDKENLLETLMM